MVGARSGVWQESDVKWEVVSRNSRNFVLGAHHCGGGAVCPVSERRTTVCVDEGWCSGAVCPGQRAGAVSPGSGSSARASRTGSRSAMRGAQRAACPRLHLLNFEARYCGLAENSDVLHDAEWILCPAIRCHPIHTRSQRGSAHERIRGRHSAEAVLCDHSPSASRRNFQRSEPES